MGKVKRESVAPGEGERRAQRGYVAQYDFAANTVHKAIADGTLQWVGLADRSAGNFDDLVLGLNEVVIAHQIKTSSKPKNFNVRTLLLGSSALLASLVSVWKKLRDKESLPIEVHYVCDDVPSDGDRTDKSGDGPSSAAFLRALEANRSTRSLEEWLGSAHGRFISELENASGLERKEFIEFLSSVSFLHSGQGRRTGSWGQTPLDARRIADISALLPRLISDEKDKDRWSLEELLHRLDWSDPFSPRHGHTFPTDALVQDNRKTQDELQVALAAAKSGYVSLVGPPGCGKSTLLQSGLLPTPQAVVLRYLAFMPNEGHELGRAEAFDFLHDLVAQLKRTGLGSDLITGTTLDELRAQLARLLSEAKKRFEKERLRTIIVVDGLDHIPREERPDRSLLNELPLPVSLPTGVLFVLGTQKLDLEGMPPDVKSQASAPDRFITVEPLSREAVFRLVDLSGLSEDGDAQIIFDRSLGHPLSVRYLIEGARNALTAEERSDWLKDGPAYGGDVENFYRSAWRDLQGNEDSREVLALLALVEGKIRVASLDGLVNSHSVDKAWDSAKHLLLRTPDDGWRIFHNSFRLFLREATSRRHDKPAPALMKERYQKLAIMARSAAADDEQRWMELRYTARAENYQAVTALCEPARFRRQFIEGRAPRAVGDDIRLAFVAVAATKSAKRLVELILTRHEIEMRTDALGVDRLIDAYIAIGDLDRAMGLVDMDGAHLSVGKAYEVVEALLAQGRTEDARRLFEEREPLGRLLGAEAMDGFSDHGVLSEWAERVALFRSPRDILTSINRLRASPDARRDDFDIANLRAGLRYTAARWVLERDSSLEYGSVADLYEVATTARPLLAFIAARSAAADAAEVIAKRRFTELVDQNEELSPSARLGAAAICLDLKWLDLAAKFFDASTPPEITADSSSGTDLDLECREVFRHATIASALDITTKPAKLVDTDLVKSLESRLKRLGWYNGRGLAQHKAAAGDAVAEIKKFATFLGKARSPGNEHDWARWRINHGLAAAADAIAETAAHCGSEALNLVADYIDEVLNSEEDNLRLPAFRRTFALTTFKFQKDRDAALSRISWEGSVGDESSPAEYFSELAEEAIGLTLLGEPERAKWLLAGMHQKGLGYALPAKKDPQYLLWRDVFERACRENSAGIPRRVVFMARLVTGMSVTEGAGAARRVAGTIIKWAAVGGVSLASATVDQIEETGLAPWSEIVGSVARGAVLWDRQMASCAAVAFARLALPFASEHGQEMLADLVEMAPDEQVDFIVTLGFTAAAVDGHLGFRSAIMQNIAEKAAARGRPVEAEIAARWVDDTEVVKFSTSNDDKLRGVQSLEELEEKLTDGTAYPIWDLNSAFQRAAEGRSFEEIEPLLARHSVLRTDEGTITLAAMIALKHGRPDAAAELIRPLEAKTAAEGSWGGWQSGAKTRVRRVEVGVRGDDARQRNFGELCLDLSRGREWSVSLLPDLADVLDLTLPRLTDAELWEILAQQLREFREYKSSHDIQYTANDEETPHTLLSDLFKRALDLKIGVLERQARIGLRELASLKDGLPSTVKAIGDLWLDGGENALQATRIAWECRNIQGIRDAVEPQLKEWSASRDLAVQRSVLALASYWHIKVEPVEADLPTFYSIELPPIDRPADYERPLGFSSYDDGLWTDDPYSWTWGLEFQLDLLSGCSPFDKHVLRRRTAVLMAQMGGRTAFGPEIAKKLKKRYSRLDLRLSYRRPMATAALLAARQTAGELAVAGGLDQSKAVFFLHETGAFNFTTDTVFPESRAPGVHTVSIPGFFASSPSKEEWAKQADNQDILRDHVSGWLCLGSVSRFERRHFADRLGADRLMVPSRGSEPCESLQEAWRRLARVEVLGTLYPIYEGVALGGVVRIHESIADSCPRWGLTLCPRAAKIIGLKTRRIEPFIYRDSFGEVALRTVWWREGGFRVDDTDDAIRGYGSLLLVRPQFVERIKHVAGETLRISAWRVSEKRTSIMASSADHRNTPTQN
jgi:energy-coupling factor transporter ATP-binding protein EcfA2